MVLSIMDVFLKCTASCSGRTLGKAELKIGGCMDSVTVSGSSRTVMHKSAPTPGRRAVACRCAVSLILLFTSQATFAQAMYRITDLESLGYGTSSGFALNASGHATGNSLENCIPNPTCYITSHAFLWKNDGSPMVDLTFPGGTSSSSSGINKSGLVTGVSDLGNGGGSHAFLSTSSGTPLLDLGTLGGATSIGEAVNDTGEVAGVSYLANDNNPHAFLWKNDGTPMQDLGTFGGYIDIRAMNNVGQAVGDASMPAGEEHAVIWNNKGMPMEDLGTLGGSYSEADDINELGEVTGYSSLSGDSVRHAFLWRNDGTSMMDLGTVTGPSSSGIAINNSGQIAGDSCRSPRCYFEHAFLWRNDGTPMQDLGALGGGESHAAALNSLGQVVGDSYLTGNTTRHAFLWRNDGTKMQDINALIDPTDPLKPYVTFVTADAINDGSQILADGIDSRTGHTHAYFLNGTVLTLTPRSLAFGNQTIKTTSATKSITMTNTSPKVVAITSVSLTGSNSNQFATTNNCGKQLAGHAICTIKAAFKPTTKGYKAALLNVNGGGGGLRTVSLTGTGI